MTGVARQNGPEPPTRVVLLGASNVQLGLPTILRVARELTDGPVDLMAALGHGRSYGRPSSIPGRTLPAILDCRLWDDLADRPRAPTFTLVTDIGNDLLYGRSPAKTLAWVAECADRLAEHGPVTITGLPIANLGGLGEWRYRAFRTLFFPAFRVSLAELAEQARELHDGLAAYSRDRSLGFAMLDEAWYGFDPIHYRRAKRHEAWRTMLGLAGERLDSGRPAAGDPQNPPPRISLRERGGLLVSVAAERRLLGFDRRRDQPCVTLGDGSRVSLY